MNATLRDATKSPTFAAEIDAEGILFDMDGVLVCSTGGDERCWMRWSEHHKLPLDIRRTHGRRAADTLREHLPDADDDAIRDHLALLDRFAAEEQTGVIAYPGVKELLTSLPPYRWTVVTSASEAMMRVRLRMAGITAPAQVVAGDHVDKGKPDPEGYRKGAALLSRTPADCVVLEDAPAGVRAGKRAGCRVIGVLSSHTSEELREAVWLVQSIDQITVQIDESAVSGKNKRSRMSTHPPSPHCTWFGVFPVSGRLAKAQGRAHPAQGALPEAPRFMPPALRSHTWLRAVWKQQNAALRRKKRATLHPQRVAVGNEA